MTEDFAGQARSSGPAHIAEDVFENAPCGYILATPDRRIVKANATLSAWLGCEPKALTGKHFTDLLTAGSRIHYETHFGPLLQLQGQLTGIAADLVGAAGAPLSVFLTANVKTDADNRPTLLRITLQDARDRRSYEHALLEERRRAEQERNRAQVLARTLQRSLLPPALFPPTGLDASAYYHAASPHEVGGDFYDLFPLSHDKWGFFLGDVCGKGAAAAAVTSLMRYALRAAAVFEDDPATVLHTLHAVLSHERRDSQSQFATVIFGVLTPRDDGFDVHLASGGHPPALLLGADGRAHYVSTAGGQPVGTPFDPTFVTARIGLRPGDTLVLYTDGLTEARTGHGIERYDDSGGLLRFAAAHAPTTASTVVQAIHSLLDRLGAGVQDDVAVLALGVPTSKDPG